MHSSSCMKLLFVSVTLKFWNCLIFKACISYLYAVILLAFSSWEINMCVFPHYVLLHQIYCYSHYTMSYPVNYQCQNNSWRVPFSFSPFLFTSTAKAKSNGSKASPRSRPFWTGNAPHKMSADPHFTTGFIQTHFNKPNYSLETSFRTLRNAGQTYLRIPILFQYSVLALIYF